MYPRFIPALFLALLIFTAGAAHQAHAFPGTNAGAPAYRAANPVPDTPNVTVTLLPEKTDLKGGETVTVGIRQKIRKGWHTYWVNPGDSGTETRASWSGVGGIGGLKADAIQWPVPKRMPIGPLMNFGYENEVVLLQDITLPKKLPAGPQTITADFEILVCQEICIPESHTASFTINDGSEAHRQAVDQARGKLPLDMGWQTEIAEENGTLIVSTKTDMPSAFTKLRSIELYPEEWGMIANPEQSAAALKNNVLAITHKRGDRDLAEIPVAKLVIAYEDASGARKAIRVSALNKLAAPNAGASAEQKDIGFSKALLLAFLGGLILNLMPCVFPVLSMKAMSLVELKDKEAAKARLHGIVYTLGILVSFALVAGLLLILKAGGAQIGWGFQLQHPAVILFLAYLFLLLGLNLAGFFEIDFGLSNAGQSLARQQGVAGTFFTGVLATIVATPCTAPFMAAAMGFALTQSAAVAMSVFLALGFGLAFPYLALSFVPALQRSLPRPGAWMETFRQFLAFLMFIAVGWLIAVLAEQVGFIQLFYAQLGLVAVAFGIWLFKHLPSRRKWRFAVIILALLSFLFAISNFFTEAAPQGRAISGEPLAVESPVLEGEPFTRARLNALLKGDDPVFVNMTAAWCITCKVNEKVALETRRVRGAFDEYGVRYLKGDWTNQNPEITNFLEEYGRSGVPIYVYYGPRNAMSGARPAPVILPQILTAGIVADSIAQQPQ
ncbi:MAG: protein-disulfide reductase DsbD domain-containing protein [Micavibrio sp.]